MTNNHSDGYGAVWTATGYLADECLPLEERRTKERPTMLDCLGHHRHVLRKTFDDVTAEKHLSVVSCIET